MNALLWDINILAFLPIDVFTVICAIFDMGTQGNIQGRIKDNTPYPLRLGEPKKDLICLLCREYPAQVTDG